ncbi:MAG: UDP-N-acetylmuramoyl-tripeptide--D-alanyl-D-alanine ligase [Polyangiaceae bacterium]|jgi:UDP-N-acetylmuramoyl-tripeptide--D-alanyl-D-alanine ligase
MATPIPANRASLTTWEAAAATGGIVARVRGDGARATGITSDSRAVLEGGAFVALRGDAHDGHDYLADSVKRGAALVVVARGRGRDVPEGPDVVEVGDTLSAWGAIAGAHLRSWRRLRRSEPARVVAITGSAGKTTTKELCAALLGAMAPCHKALGNLNNRVGLPSVVLGLEAHHRFAVLEMGMNMRGEIAALCAIARPDVAVVTNVGVAHAEGVGGTRGDVAREKGEIFATLSRESTAVANADDAAALGELTRTEASNVVTFGRSDRASYRLVDRESLGEHGSRVVITRPDRRAPLEAIVPLVGEAAAIDFVAAVAAVEAAGGWTLTTGVVRDALAALTPPEGRATVRTIEDIVVLDDTYNANPSSVRAALATLSELARTRGGRAVAVLGEMKELGARAREEHVAIGDALLEAGVSLAIGCGGLASVAVERAAALGVATVDAPDVASAAREVVSRARGGDVILVKGSRSVGAEAVVAALAKRKRDPA